MYLYKTNLSHETRSRPEVTSRGGKRGGERKRKEKAILNSARIVVDGQRPLAGDLSSWVKQNKKKNRNSDVEILKLFS